MPLIGLLGLICLIIVMADFLMTTVGTNDTSPIAMRIGKLAFRLVRRLPETDLKHKVIGPLVVATAATWWILGVNLSWAMIFMGVPDSLVEQKTGRTADAVGYISHVGHLLSTVGGGPTSPASTGIALLGVVVAVNGMIVLTLAVSFVMSTTQTVVEGRRLLLYLGASRTGDADVLKDLAGLTAQLNTAPFALFFSHQDAGLRIPEQLSHIFTRRLDDPDVEWSRLVRALPYFQQYSDAGMATGLERWLSDFSARRPD